MGFIEDVLEACIGSARAEPLKLVQKGKIRSVEHSQLNVMFLMPPASGKSTFLDTIRDDMVVRILDYSYPAMVGTIKKNGEVIPGYVTMAAGKAMLIDEFHSLPALSYRALLSLLEQQRTHRTLGYNVNMPFKKKTKYYKLVVKGNKIDIDNVRFSCLCSGLFARNKTIDDMAFLSRFLPIRFNPSIDEAYDVLLGKRKRDIKPVFYHETPVFEEYEKFVKCHKSVVKSIKLTNPKLYSFLFVNFCLPIRDVLHFSRLFSYLNRNNSTIVDWEKYLSMIPFFLYNFAATSLTLTEFEVLEYYNLGMKSREIARQRAVSEPAISKIIKKLRGVGLVK